MEKKRKKNLERNPFEKEKFGVFLKRAAFCCE